MSGANNDPCSILIATLHRRVRALPPVKQHRTSAQLDPIVQRALTVPVRVLLAFVKRARQTHFQLMIIEHHWHVTINHEPHDNHHSEVRRCSNGTSGYGPPHSFEFPALMPRYCNEILFVYLLLVSFQIQSNDMEYQQQLHTN
ncbi:hypothetical protein RB195_013181 [Necator americanus]|uniref:Uncharacterized protein n=1 Tax=Necator americanus TaxID=51031 RepID=A0ABR1DV02_NECAM